MRAIPWVNNISLLSELHKTIFSLNKLGLKGNKYMTRKAMSIIGRIIGLLLVVALAFGITWCATNWSKVQAESQKVWDKLFGKNDKQEQVQPAPNEEQFSLDGLYYINVDGDYSFVQIRDYSPETQIGSYGIVGGCMKDSQICLFKGWESRIEVDSIRIVEDDKYLHLLYQNSNEIECQIMIYDKASKTLYYDFSNGDQLPGGTYEEQLLSVMTPFTEFVEIECQHETIMDMTKTHPTCTEAGLKENWCYDCNKLLGTETLPALGHNYVGGKCTRCGESDPNHVEEVASIDGLYYRARTDGTVDVFQIEGAKYTSFVGYTQNNDVSKIYFTQGWKTYIEQYGLSLTINENDAQIICGVPELMEQYKDYPELYEAYSNYFVYDKQTKELSFGMNKVVLTRIEVYDILPYEEPRIYVENNVLHLTDMTGIGGTYTVYYQFVSGSYDGEYPDSYFEEQAYVAGNVAEFDLSLLINRENVPMLKGCTYQIRVVFATADGFLIRGYEPVQYTVPNGETAITYQLNYDLGSLMEFVQTDPNGQYTTTEIAINFTSNGKSYSMIKIEYGTGGEPTPYLLFDSDIIYYVPSSNNIVWTDEAYRTITFETAPSGDLLAWLQANATPQA